MLIGLTGGIGCGKSTVLAMFRDLGCPVFSSDEAVAELLEDPAVQKELKERFGLMVFRNGALDKRALADVVFGGPGPLRRLESILHPRVLERLEAFASAHAGALAVAEVPLLFEKKLEERFDRTVCVHCPPATARRRYARARGVSEEEADRRAAWQLPIETKKRWADHCIDTSGLVEDVRRQVEALVEEWKVLADRPPSSL